MPRALHARPLVHDLGRTLWVVPSYGANPHWFRPDAPACPFPVAACGLWAWDHNLWPRYGRGDLNAGLARAVETFAIAGDDYGQIVRLGLTGLNELNTGGGTLYWTITYTGEAGDKTMTLALYRDPAHTQPVADAAFEHWDEVPTYQTVQVGGGTGIWGTVEVHLTGHDDADGGNSITPEWTAPEAPDANGEWEATLELRLHAAGGGELAMAQAVERGNYAAVAGDGTVSVGLTTTFPAYTGTPGAPLPRFNGVGAAKTVSGDYLWDGPELWFTPGAREVLVLRP